MEHTTSAVCPRCLINGNLKITDELLNSLDNGLTPNESLTFRLCQDCDQALENSKMGLCPRCLLKGDVKVKLIYKHHILPQRHFRRNNGNNNHILHLCKKCHLKIDWLLLAIEGIFFNGGRMAEADYFLVHQIFLDASKKFI